ncbi:MAG TPA: hypothetical protein VF069_09230 [Streptosporangiaceae bacterium]
MRDLEHFLSAMFGGSTEDGRYATRPPDFVNFRPSTSLRRCIIQPFGWSY